MQWVGRGKLNKWNFIMEIQRKLNKWKFNLLQFNASLPLPNEDRKSDAEMLYAEVMHMSGQSARVRAIFNRSTWCGVTVDRN